MIASDNFLANLEGLGHFDDGTHVVALEFEGFTQLFVLLGNLQVGIDMGRELGSRSSSVCGGLVDGTGTGETSRPTVEFRVGQGLGATVFVR